VGPVLPISMLIAFILLIVAGFLLPILATYYLIRVDRVPAEGSKPRNDLKRRAVAISLGVTSCFVVVYSLIYMISLSPSAKNRQLEGRIQALGGEATCKRVYHFTGPPAPSMGSGGYSTHCWVDFKGSSLSDNELAALVPDFSAVNLRVLDLRDTGVTDVSVESISSFTGANWSGTLNVSDTQISAAGASKLRSKFPFATIKRD